MAHHNRRIGSGASGRLRALVAAATCAAALSLAGSAQAQSGCSAAMPDFMAALKVNTAPALEGYLEKHAPCFEAPVRAKLQQLGGSASAVAPDPATQERYDGSPVSITALGSPGYLGQALVAAKKRFWNEGVPAIGNVSAAVQPDYGGYSSLGFMDAIKDGKANAVVVRASVAYGLGGAFGSVLAGLDAPLLTLDASVARSVQDTVLPRVREAVRSQRLMILGTGPALPPMLVWNQPMASLSDLKGRAVVSFEPASEVVAVFGGKVLKLPPGDARSALEQDSIDCVVMAATIIMRTGLHESGRYLVPATALGWGVNALVMNAAALDALPEAVRTGLLQKAESDFSAPLWNGVSAAIQADIGCLRGAGKCANGIAPGDLKLANPLPLDAAGKGVLHQSILPNWATSAPGGLVDGWRADAGRVVNLQ